MFVRQRVKITGAEESGVGLKTKSCRQRPLLPRPRIRTGASILLLLCGGCSSSYQPKTTQDNIDSYLSNAVLQVVSNGGVTSGNYQVFTIDHTTSTFTEESLAGLGQLEPDGTGSFTTTSNGFLDIALQAGSTSGTEGNFALEIPGVMGFFGSQGSVYPMVTNASCPSLSKAQPFQFLSLSNLSSPTNNVAYGNVSILASGDTVSFTAINQYQFPTSTTPAGTAVTDDPGPASISGNCGSSAYGQVVSIAQVIPIEGQSPTQAVDTLNINSGFLFENGLPSGNSSVPPNVLGSGGAVGLATPSSQLNTTSLVGDSYNAFISYAGAAAAFSGASAGSTACGALQASLQALSIQPSANTLYGGEFANGDPSANTTSNCDVAIDLGTEDANNNGLYTGVTVYLGTAYPGNSTGAVVVLPALAIGGEIGSQSALFVGTNMALTGTAPLQIYLLQASK